MDDKIKYELEFPIQASPAMLYTHISTPSGLSGGMQIMLIVEESYLLLFGMAVKNKPSF